MQTGSLINNIYSNALPKEPEVGMGVTECMWSDRHAYTIVEVKGDKLVIQRDKVIRVDKNGFSESQEYTYEPNPNSSKITIAKRKDGRYRQVGSGNGGSVFSIGFREEYYDYSF